MYSVLPSRVSSAYQISLAEQSPNCFAHEKPHFLLTLVDLRLEMTGNRNEILAKPFLIFLKLAQKKKQILAKLFIFIFYSKLTEEWNKILAKTFYFGRKMEQNF